MSRAALARLTAIVIALALALPGPVLRVGGFELSAFAAVPIYAAAFVGAALLLSWGTELAQLDLPPGVAVALLAFIAILPEYAVDLLFAYQAGTDPQKAPLALANMTGANRLLIGLGWSLVALTGALGARAARRRGTREGREGHTLALSRRSAVDVFVLGSVSVYTLTFVFRNRLTLAETLILFAAFGFYSARLWTAPKEEPELMGPPAAIRDFPTWARRSVTVLLMLVAGAVIFLSAEPFSSALIAGGKALGIDEFLMVQWLAPLATETAELIPACIFAFRQNADQGLGTLLSSKINQWTLLVGGVPIAFAIAHGGLGGLPVDPTQREELLLTAAQSVFAVTLLTDDLRLGTREALIILALFLADLATSIALPEALRPWARLGFSAVYLTLSTATLVRARGHLRELAHNAIVVPIRELSASEHEPRGS